MPRTAGVAIVALLLVVAQAFARPATGSAGARPDALRAVGDAVASGDAVSADDPPPTFAGRWRPVGKASASPADVRRRPGRSGSYLGRWLITCYALSGTTFSGRQVSTDVVAVDPRLIPIGTRLYIDGIGLRTAADTGAKILGHHLDIWMPNEHGCMQFGARQFRVYRA